MDDARGMRLGEPGARLADRVDDVFARQPSREDRVEILPSRYSSTMNGRPSDSVPKSETRATCSLRKLAVARASRRNRATAPEAAPFTLRRRASYSAAALSGPRT